MVNRELENGRGRTFIRPRQNTIFRPVRSYNSERENNNQSRGPNVVQSNFFNPVSVSPTVEQINNNCVVKNTVYNIELLIIICLIILILVMIKIKFF